MKIIVAPDAFKGSMSAVQAARAIERGLKRAMPEAEIVRCPLADGGEGTLDVFRQTAGSTECPVPAVDPLGRSLEAPLILLEGGDTAVIELARTAGLDLLSPKERNPLRTSTAGVGMQILRALDKGVRTVILTIGGSATNDGGMGMIRVLGGRFLDGDEHELEGTGGDLLRVVHMDLSGLDSRIAQTEFKVLCDVNNPFYGPRGAARVYAPQKGADAHTVEELDRGLVQLARLIQEKTGVDLQKLPGAGAAGGFGGGAAALLGARLVSGIQEVLEISGFEQMIEGGALVLTGEGRTDGQTLEGKVPYGVLQKTREAGIPLVVLSGSLGEGANRMLDAGAAGLFSIQREPGTLESAMSRGEELLEDAALRIGVLFRELMVLREQERP